MNNERRNKIKKEIAKLEAIKMVSENVYIDSFKSIISDVKKNINTICDDEQFAFDNMPEGLQCSMRGETSEECIDMLDDAMDLMDDVISSDTEDKDKILKDVQEIIDNLYDVIYA